MEQNVILTYGFDSLIDAPRRSWMRPHDRLLTGLARDLDITRLMVADPFRSAPARLTGRRLNVSPVVPGAALERWHLSPLRMLASEPSSPRASRYFHSSYGRRLRTASGRLGLSGPVLISTHPGVAAHVPPGWCRRVVYYARDDWAEHGDYQEQRRNVLAAYAEMRRRSVDVVAVSRTLLNRLAPTGDGSVVPNGVDAETWRPAGPAPDWLASLPSPRLVYLGSIDDRLDVEAVRSLARSGVGQIVLVGPVMRKDAIADLDREPGVHLAGNLPHAEAARAVQHCDLGLMLHRDTPLTRAMDPLKLHEYLAAGLPVVASDLPEHHERGPRVVVSSRDVVRAARHAMGLGRLPERERLVTMAELSWETRYRSFVDFALRPSGSSGADYDDV